MNEDLLDPYPLSFAWPKVCGLEHTRNPTTQKKAVEQFSEEWSDGVDNSFH